METALIVMFIILAIESFALQFLYVKFYQEKRKTSLRIERNNENLVERSNYYIKQKIEEALVANKKFEELQLERFINELQIKVKCLEAYFDLVYKTETDGHIFRSYYEKESDEKGHKIKFNLNEIRKHSEKLNKEIEKLQSNFKIFVFETKE